MGLILCINENADRLSPLLTHRMRCHTRVSAPQHTASEVAGVRDWSLRLSTLAGTCSWRAGARLQNQRDASCRMEAMTECCRVDGADGVLTRARNRLPNPVSRLDAAEEGTRVRPTTLWSCVHVRVPWSREGGAYRETLLQTLNGCRVQYSVSLETEYTRDESASHNTVELCACARAME